ncbi:MAG TPA: M15 family metallopeptidase [Polyangiaceae bacterium]|nr:M15 family metallopeptidase [Polyangiaceae bacterium]
MGRSLRLLGAAFCVTACATGRTTAPVHIASRVPVALASTSSPAFGSVAPMEEVHVSSAPPPELACLVRYYDAAAARRDAGGWSLVLADGTTIPYDDGRAHKSLDERFDSPDVRDLYELTYPTGAIQPVTEVDFDPGRIRIDALMFATYGKTAREVQSALVPVLVGGKVFMVHRKIAEPLRRVAARVASAMKEDASLARFFDSPGGTFNWRRIAGTDTLSMHSWGIAIDLDTGRSNYWRNETTREDAPVHWKNHYPPSLVDAFEAEGFVWGGRWYHFDTMHFEYRPELLDRGCYPSPSAR